MAKATAAIERGQGRDDPKARPSAAAAAPSRPGWVLELVLAVLASANEPLRPQEVIRRAESMHEFPLTPSSVRNALRVASRRADNSVERVGYGCYRLRGDRRQQ